MSDEAGLLEADADVAEPAPDLPLLSMLFTASSWTANARFNRSGRMESEAIYSVGELSFASAAGERRKVPARVIVLPKDPKLRLDLVLSPEEAIITVPLEEFSMQRLREQMKELVSGYGMVMRIGFRAADMAGRQMLGSVDFTFSLAPRTGAAGTGRTA